MRILIPLTLAAGCTPGDYWYFRTSGVDIPVRVEGNLDSGVVLVMLHGGPGGSAVDYNFGLDAELLEDAYAVAYYDQRGQGGTHGSYDISRYTVQQVADDNANLVRALRARYGDDTSVWLYGHSWGGMLGTATLLDTDADVDGWIESAGSHDYPLNDTYSADMLLTVAAEEVEAGSEYTADWRRMIALFAGTRRSRQRLSRRFSWYTGDKGLSVPCDDSISASDRAASSSRKGRIAGARDTT